MTFDQQKAIQNYTELMRRVSVGAYTELESDGSFPPDDGTPESLTLESVHNLEELAARYDLEFCWEASNGAWVLLPMSDEMPAIELAGEESEEEHDHTATS